MENNQDGYVLDSKGQLYRRPEHHPVVALLFILLVVALGFIVIGPMVGFFVALPFYPGSMMEMLEALQNPADHPELKTPYYIIQGFATFIGLIVSPAFYMKANRRSIKDLFTDRSVDWMPILVTVIVVIVFTGMNSVVVEWNANFKFPEFMRDFEIWARGREDLATELTEFLTRFESPFELFIAMIVIAVLPAIGEEIVFRGLIQNELLRATRNVHVSIWVAAILFSAIHIQFFGFVPRMLLGALFGYLYYWSGNLTLAILAHFVNNGFSVLLLYFYQQGAFDYNVESPEALPAHFIMISAICTGGLLYYFYKYFEHRKPATPLS
jgi:uncharacterized protein